MGQKIGSQPEAQDRYVKINDDLSELINLLRCEKLAFVNDYDLAVRVLGLIKIIYIGILITGASKPMRERATSAPSRVSTAGLMNMTFMPRSS